MKDVPPVNTNDAEAQACQYIARMVYDHCRIRLDDGKDMLIKARLSKHMRRLGFSSLPDYCNFLQTGADAEELTNVIDSLTTNFTHFLREEDHFKFMVQEALPELLGGRNKEFTLWSAASSSGEEAYSIGIYLSEYFPSYEGWNWHVSGSDISTQVLHSAQTAVYAMDRLKAMPEAWIRKYFDKGIGACAGKCRVKQSLTERVSFRQINLVEPYDHERPFEIIFCRNVMIYFDRTTQEQLVRRLCQHLTPRGYLFIGGSETLQGLGLPLRCLRPSVYQKTGY